MSEITDLGFEVRDVTPGEGWHCSHFFYSFDRPALARLKAESPSILQAAKDGFIDALSNGDQQPARFQLGMTSGHKADFSLMLMDPDPIKVEAVHQRLLGSEMGQVLNTTWSYVSISEISEYALSVEQYGERLKRQGEDPESSAFQKKIAAYGGRVEKMNSVSYTHLTLPTIYSV